MLKMSKYLSTGNEKLFFPLNEGDFSEPHWQICSYFKEKLCILINCAENMTLHFVSQVNLLIEESLDISDRNTEKEQPFFLFIIIIFWVCEVLV